MEGCDLRRLSCLESGWGKREKLRRGRNTLFSFFSSLELIAFQGTLHVGHLEERSRNP